MLREPSGKGVRKSEFRRVTSGTLLRLLFESPLLPLKKCAALEPRIVKIHDSDLLRHKLHCFEQDERESVSLPSKMIKIHTLFKARYSVRVAPLLYHICAEKASVFQFRSKRRFFVRQLSASKNKIMPSFQKNPPKPLQKNRFCYRIAFDYVSIQNRKERHYERTQQKDSRRH